MSSRIYLDNAATTWPKPESVYAAVDRYQRESGAPAGRGAYAEATEVGRLIASTRRAVAELIGAKDPNHIVFTLNGTDALNLAIHGALSKGGHAITTHVEHNSVLRPLRTLEDGGHITVTRVQSGADGIVDPAQVRVALRTDTRLVVLTHASNVTGAIQPAAEIGKLAREHGALFLLDAAQTAGELPIDVSELGVDLLAAPGHKGLLGPLGTGVLYLRPSVESHVACTREGGTGSESESDRQPDALPEKYESGNLNVTGIAGLGAGAAWLKARGLETIRQHTLELTQRLLDGLASIVGVRLFGPTSAAARVGVVSAVVEGYAPQEVAAMLDSAYRVQTRAGLHCAPLMHQALGTISQGGTVRFSVGPFNTVGHIEQAVAAMQEIAASRLVA
jgi:cysteine desulfurase family protein